MHRYDLGQRRRLGDGFESHPTTAAPPLAACPRGRWSPRTGLTCARAGAIAAASELRCPSPAVPQTCPKQRSTAVTKGQHRSTGKVADLRHRRTASSTAVLPKLAVARRPGPCWVRTASGTAGPRRARAVNVGESASQVRRRSPSRPWTAKQPGAGFEPLTQPPPWADLGLPVSGPKVGPRCR
jgi:hypothetical protein